MKKIFTNSNLKTLKNISSFNLLSNSSKKAIIPSFSFISLNKHRTFLNYNTKSNNLSINTNNSINNFQRSSFSNTKNKDNEDSDEKDIDKDFQPIIKSQPNISKTKTILEEIDDIVKSNEVVLFMKGTKEMPRCGFSNYLIQVLKFYKINNFKDVNVLETDEIRQAVKEYSNWPTFPQLYIKGELIGGSDIVKDMHENGTFQELCERNNLIKEE